MLRTYDVLHFAGHCVYDKANPAASGWIFSNGERLSAFEFTRIDRSPAFVFSNACESGITPARSDERSVDLAPSFAESFFARGVTNFVCTAWPVDDRAARDFAFTLYAGLLGLETTTSTLANTSRNLLYRAGTPLVMHEAMRRARVAIATPPSDTRTWGAYQHYGNPYFRFFDPVGMSEVKKRSGPERANGVDAPAVQYQTIVKQDEPVSAG
jgi:CHAT domain-containing protein